MYHGYLWSGDARSQGISSYGIDLFIEEYSTESTRGVMSCDKTSPQTCDNTNRWFKHSHYCYHHHRDHNHDDGDNNNDCDHDDDNNNNCDGNRNNYNNKYLYYVIIIINHRQNYPYHRRRWNCHLQLFTLTFQAKTIMEKHI